MRRVRSGALALSMVISVAACGDPIAPADVAGVYHATIFTVRFDNDVPIDVLAAGAALTIDLNADGTTTGELVVPVVPGVFSEAFTESMAGTYRLNDDRVTFDSEVDTFVDDFVFIFEGGNLQATYTFFSGNRTGFVTMVLTKE